MTEIKKDIAWRIYTVYVVVCLFAMVIVGKALTIQLVEGDELKKKIQSLTTVDKSIEAVRGNIYAEDGSLLATSIPIYEVRFDPNADAITAQLFKEKVDSLAWHLSDLFKDKSIAAYRKELINARQSGARYHLIRRNVKFTQLKKMKQFPLFRRGKYKGGFIFIQRNKREMPFKVLAARTIGYEREDVTPVGLEGAYSEVLSGIDGQRLMQKIAGGVWMPLEDADEIEPEDGMDIYTTIDVNLQDVAESALMKQLQKQQADHGTVVLMEVKTGAIKAIANLKRNASGDYYEGYNYAIGESTEPGSTFKLPALIAAIEDGYVDMDDLINCGDGSKKYYDHTMYDSNHDEGGWGKITVQRILEVSSNIGMAEIITRSYGQQPQKFIDHLAKMNLKMPLGIEIAGEGKPYIKNTNDESWSGISLAWMAHGYELQQTPLQILTFYNAVANGGVMVKPKFVEKVTKGRKVVNVIETEVINSKICSKSTIEKVQKALEGVVTDGTARNLRNADYKIAGKTGTAQIANKNYGYKYQSNVSYQASFVGYFPADNPEFSCIVVINAPSQNVYYGNLVAGPIFKEVADKVYANSLDMHEQLKAQSFMANSAIPYSKHGSKQDIETIFNELKIPVESKADDADWIVTRTNEASVTIAPRVIRENLVPNVIGMGLRDAIFLLENQGLRVKISGSGMVKNQSIPAGVRIRNGQLINIELS
ncbi:MAG: PASTA domain-containing protein [Bacteroidetes bacterium]|nr:MAG: PASTA domain-containing protein [Bacteroidota bacterium]MBL1145738.1 PASTA domain-containing protein [Bacteroidota bacterium]MCB0803231.1 transpeptidase family protein [Flavobacteriales bacterium]NOG58532.1 transpeptidase family protein [Bacteroidota bacterium]